MPSAGYKTHVLNVNTVQKQRSPISISSESSKIHLIMKVLSGLTFAYKFLFHHAQIVSVYIIALSSATLSCLRT